MVIWKVHEIYQISKQLVNRPHREFCLQLRLIKAGEGLPGVGRLKVSRCQEVVLAGLVLGGISSVAKRQGKVFRLLVFDPQQS